MEALKIASPTIRPLATPAPTAAAAPAASSEPRDGVALTGQHDVQVVRRVSPENSKWAWTEDLHDSDPHFKQHDFNPRQVQRSADVVAGFGTNAPFAGDVLLHYAGDPPAGVKKHPIPVVCVHGAGSDGDYFIDPMTDGSVKGTAETLREQGFQVYSVTFALNQDDNNVWTQGLANAVQRVKDLTGQPQVDLVAHSKGCVAARAYLSNFREDWMTPYRGDVHRVAFEASPFKGIDYLFRHPVANYALYGSSGDWRLNSPMSWSGIMMFGVMLDAHDQGMGKDGRDDYPGQRQLLDFQKAPLAMAEQDWYTTMNGGRGFVSYSEGMKHFIEDSGNYMPRLEQTPIDPNVEVAVLAGDNPNIQGILNEYTGPSDGLLFLDSALAIPQGARVIAEKVMHINHLQMEMDPKAEQWTADVLAAENPKPLSQSEVDGIRHQALHEASAVALPAAPPKLPENLIKTLTTPRSPFKSLVGDEPATPEAAAQAVARAAGIMPGVI